MIEQDETGDRDDAGRWTKGTSGNPAGRPAGSGSIVTELRRLMQETDGSGENAAAVIAKQLVELAKGGDLRAIREMIDRIDGHPQQSVSIDAEVFTFGDIVL